MGNLFEITSKFIISHYFYFNIHSISSYPPVFTEKRFRKFLQTYTPQSSFIPFLNDRKQYQLLCQNITARLTSEKANPIETRTHVSKEKDSAHIELQEKQSHSTTSKSTDKVTSLNKFIIHYTHERRFSSFKLDMHHIYDQTFIEHICNDIKFIVGNRNRRANTRELINKRPKKYLLTNHHRKTPVCIYHPVLIKSIFLSSRNSTQETQHKRNILETSTNRTRI